MSQAHGLSAGRQFGVRDVVAGLSVALILIPQSLAYAELAGLPAYVGLFAAGLPPVAAAFFASSRYLQTGPVAMTALLTYGALEAFGHPPESSEWVALAALLAILVGIIRLIMGLARWGVIAYLLSQPVLVGFTAAASLLIIGSQLPTALGVAAPPRGIVTGAVHALSSPGEWSMEAIGVSLATIALVMGGRRVHRLFPGVLLAVVGGIALSSVVGYGAAIVGDVPAGLPPLSLDLPWGQTAALFVPALVVALVGFAEPVSIARTFAVADRERWSADRELISQGVANLASGISGGFPVGGSFSRTSVNRLAGGRSRWAGAVTGLTVLAFMPFAGVLESLPRAVLAAIVIAAVARLVRPDHVYAIWKRSRPQGAIGAVTFLSTLLLEPRIEQGVLLGISLAVVVHLWRELRVRMEIERVDDTLRVRPQGVLFFASTPDLEDRLLASLEDEPGVRVLVLDLSSLGRVDFTGAEALKALVSDAEAAGLEVRIEGVPPQARGLLERVWGRDL